jgi:alpha-mannosidase
VECEPWMGWRPWKDGSAILDEKGKRIPYQVMNHEALVQSGTRLVFKVKVGPGKMRVLRIDGDAGIAPPMEGVEARECAILNDMLAVQPGCISYNKTGLSIMPHLDLLEDRSDTWSHRFDRYPEGPVVSAQWNNPCVVEDGPLMATLLQTGRIGESRLEAEWRVYADEPFADLRLRVTWLETLRILKLTIPLPTPVAERTDGIMGGSLERVNDGKERPLRDWVLVPLDAGRGMGVVCPDVFALDATPRRLRLTLLRSPFMAHHDPHPGTAPRRTVADQGVHDFRFRFFLGRGLKPELLDAHALMLQRPLVFADLTRGMPPRTDV